ncbi:protein kinase interacting protein [Maruca vitrata nucleopolyhedrovirus]|uniref:Protein kinase interacting protein n=1 Tax=Maruca vitrata nucleopolyhedrovirus TaxID=1307954 RepID=A1YR77_9ABAC|nr:protein kinase interacting protein [Maruca vitrata nucleopolyhedrovirus]ABL75967.1 protein kinase interacting protein [Maruca vitrata nucleopolyhedrovirus]
MSCILTAFCKKNQASLNNLIKLQNKKVKNYYAKNNENAIDKMLCIAADIRGQVEQLELVSQYLDAPESEKLNFVNDCSDLDINEEDLLTKNITYFTQKYNAPIVLKVRPSVYDSFIKHSELFINAICQMDEKQYSLDELVKLKLTAIKHLCALEYLIDK